MSVGNEEGACGGESSEGGVYGHLCLTGIEDERVCSTGMTGDIQAGMKIELDCPVDEREHFGSESPVGAHLLSVNHLFVADVCHLTPHGLTDGCFGAENE